MDSSSLIRLSNEHLGLEEINKQFANVEDSVKLYFSSENPRFHEIFSLYSQDELLKERDGCLVENELNASMTVLAAVEAAFRIDFELRCRENNTEPLSNRFRKMRHGRIQHTISFTQDILGIWEKEYPKSAEVVADLRKAFRFRNWLAHGRYWIPDTGKIDYGDICALAESAFSALPLEGLS